MNLPKKHKLQNGKYQIVEIIGQGGFGITYKAVWHTEVKGKLGKVTTDVPICIKEYFFKDYCYRDEHTCFVKNYSENAGSLFERFKEKLIREAKILSKLQHPNIVNVLEVFEENNTAYIAMEYIDGLSLKEIMEQRKTHFSLSEAAHYIRGVANALSFIHGKNITHFDIKPSNIIINKSGEAQLIDFGVSKDYEIDNLHTSTTMISLSKGYASIEQYDRDAIKSFSPLPDIYALGATFYNLLTGITPTESILRVTRPITPPSEIDINLPQEIDSVILKAMSILPEERYQNIEEFLKALETVNIPIFEFKPSNESLVDDVSEIIKDAENNLISDLDDETVLANGNQFDIKELNDILSDEKSKKPSKIKILAFLLVMSFIALIISYSLIFLRKDLKISKLPKTKALDTLVNFSDNQINNIKNHQEETITSKESIQKLLENIPKQPLSETSIKQESSDHMVNKIKPDKKKVEIEENDGKEETLKQKNELAYKSLIDKAKALIQKEDYLSAITSLEKAKDIFFTEEVVSLTLDCKEKLKQKELENKKFLYEEKMRFGNLMIVRNKETGNYGALDLQLNEIIPCKYISVGIAGENRAFERQDFLFDIYSPTGKLLEERKTDY